MPIPQNAEERTAQPDQGAQGQQETDCRQRHAQPPADDWQEGVDDAGTAADGGAGQQDSPQDTGRSGGLCLLLGRFSHYPHDTVAPVGLTVDPFRFLLRLLAKLLSPRVSERGISEPTDPADSLPTIPCCSQTTVSASAGDNAATGHSLCGGGTFCKANLLSDQRGNRRCEQTRPPHQLASLPGTAPR
jgi:hypothetical protein